MLLTVKSTYDVITKDRNEHYNGNLNNIWKVIWEAKIHPRHTLLLWKLVHGILPTLTRLHSYLPVLDTACYLCGESEETIHHLFLACLITKIL